MGGEDGGEKRSLASSDIHDLSELREIVGLGRRRVLLFDIDKHSLVKGRRVLEVLRQILKESHPVNIIKCGLAGLDAVQQTAPRLPEPWSTTHQGDGTQRPGHAAQETGCSRRESEGAVFTFTKHLYTCQRTSKR